MQIGDLARKTGVHIETIRYYERSGLIPAPGRLANGRRTYADHDVQRLGFIRHARQLGFDLGAIRGLLALQEQPEAPCSDVSQIAKAQLVAVEGRIGRLRLLKKELKRMIEGCRDGIVAECRIIESLSGERTEETSVRTRNRHADSPDSPTQSLPRSDLLNHEV